MIAIERLAPSDETAVNYDRQHLALYAELLGAEHAGLHWREAAATILRLDVTAADAEACWRSHIDRARWIVGDGLAAAVAAFGVRAR